MPSSQLAHCPFENTYASHTKYWQLNRVAAEFMRLEPHIKRAQREAPPTVDPTDPLSVLKGIDLPPEVRCGPSHDCRT